MNTILYAQGYFVYAHEYYTACTLMHAAYVYYVYSLSWIVRNDTECMRMQRAR